MAELPAGHPNLLRYGLGAAAVARALEHALTRGDDRLLLAVQDRSPVGWVWWQPLGAFGRSPYVRLLVVARSAGGRGVGGRLMDAVEAEAFEHAADLFLLVTADNERARRFYARRSFLAVGTLHDYVLPGVDEVLMRKSR